MGQWDGKADIGPDKHDDLSLIPRIHDSYGESEELTLTSCLSSLYEDWGTLAYTHTHKFKCSKNILNMEENEL